MKSLASFAASLNHELPGQLGIIRIVGAAC